MNDKRVERRSPIELAASYGIGEDPRPGRQAKINNMSSGGFCFASDHKLRIGEKVQLMIDLDTVEDVIITVKVVWVSRDENDRKYIIGVQIEEKEGPGFDRFIEFYNNTI